MAKKLTYNKYHFFKWILFLFIPIVILFMNKFNKNINLSISFFINKSVFIIYDFFHSIPTKYYIYTANKTYLSNLYIQNQDLLFQLSEMNTLRFKVAKLSKDNTELLNMLNVLENKHYSIKNIVTTLVYNKYLTGSNSYFVLELGKNENINDSYPVIFNKYLIGRTFDTTETNSKVMLITDTKSRIPVYSETSKIDAILAGNNTNNPLVITYQNNDFIPGEKILTSGLGGVFPRNIEVGTIYKNNNQWIIKLDYNVQNIGYINIIIKKK